MNGDLVLNPETEVTEYPSDVDVSDAILAGKPATVYHLVRSLEDISCIQQEGFKGGYNVKMENGEPLLDTDGRSIPITYFLLTLKDVDFKKLPKERMVKLDINQNGESLRIYDGREDKAYTSPLELMNSGFNGLITKPGVFTPLTHKYEIKLFGRDFGKKIVKVFET